MHVAQLHNFSMWGRMVYHSKNSTQNLLGSVLDVGCVFGRNLFDRSVCVQVGRHGSARRHAGWYVQKRRTHIPQTPWCFALLQARERHR